MMSAMMSPMTATGTMPGGMGTTMPGMAPGMNYLMVPRCTVKMEKMTGGMKVVCGCEDQMARGALQNLCASLAGTMCGCCCMMNGMMVCCCNLMMGVCKCEMTKEGVTMTCTSGDKDCANMIQACCDAMTAMMQAGCTCCVMMNNMPVCCG
jgi:hypothetical protein